METPSRLVFVFCLALPALALTASGGPADSSPAWHYRCARFDLMVLYTDKAWKEAQVKGTTIEAVIQGAVDHGNEILRDALEAYARVRRDPTSTRPQAQARRHAVEAARARLEGSLDAIERDKRSRTRIAQPERISLKALQDTLREDEAFAWFLTREGGLGALLVTAGKVRRVEIKAPGWEQAAGALTGEVADTPAGDFEKARRTLAHATLDALELPPAVRTLIVCPGGLLASCPWSGDG
jgi:hypothetical protein